jgi:hypothetical protein
LHLAIPKSDICTAVLLLPDALPHFSNHFTNRRSSLFGQTWFGVPNPPDILGNGAVAGEPAGCGEVQDHLAGPRRLVGIQFPQPLMGLRVAGEVGQMPVVVAGCSSASRMGVKMPGSFRLK